MCSKSKNTDIPGGEWSNSIEYLVFDCYLQANTYQEEETSGRIVPSKGCITLVTVQICTNPLGNKALPCRLLYTITSGCSSLHSFPFNTKKMPDFSLYLHTPPWNKIKLFENPLSSSHGSCIPMEQSVTRENGT